MTNSVAEKIKDFVGQHATELESLLRDALPVAEVVDPQLAAIAPLFTELTDVGKIVVHDVVQAIHNGEKATPTAAAPDPTAGQPAASDPSSPAGGTETAGAAPSTAPMVASAEAQAGNAPA